MVEIPLTVVAFGAGFLLGFAIGAAAVTGCVYTIYRIGLKAQERLGSVQSDEDKREDKRGYLQAKQST